METYSKENEESLHEFRKLRAEKDKLLAEKFSLVSKANLAIKENQANADEVLVLTGTLNDLRITQEDLEKKHEQILEELQIMK